MWTLDDGLATVRAVQTTTRHFHYHLAIGGGVVNRGESKKDLDLYFLPLDDGNRRVPADLLKHLEGLWGKSEPIGDPDYGGGAETKVASAYAFKVKFQVGGRRIDAFII